jgi:hypothetical protein
VPNQPRVLKSYVDDDNPDASIALHRAQHESYLLERAVSFLRCCLSMSEGLLGRIIVPEISR